MSSVPPRNNDVVQTPTQTEAPTTFPLRLLLQITTWFAVIFALIGTLSRDWSLGQLLLYVLQITVWSLAAGVVTFAMLNQYRRAVGGLGVLQMRIDLHRRPRISPGNKAAAVLAFWSFLSAFAIDRGSTALDDYHVFATIGLFFVQTILVYEMVTRPGTLEIYQHGLYARQIPGAAWSEIVSSRWDLTAEPKLMVKIYQAGANGNPLELPVDVDKIAIVDGVLLQRLGNRHIPNSPSGVPRRG